MAARIAGADLLPANKLGTPATQRQGLAPLVGEALDRGIPDLVGLNGLDVPAFHAVAGVLAVALPLEAEAVVDWNRGAALWQAA